MATVLSVGSVTVSASGGATGDLLAKITAAATGAAQTITATAGSTTVPAASGSNQLLVIPTASTNVTIPSTGTTYAYVLYSGSGTITGGGSNTAIVGNSFTYSGPAQTVVATGSSANVSDTATDAVLSFATGSYTVNASGGADTVAVDTGSTSAVTLSGAGDTLNLGTPPSDVAAGTAALTSGSTVTAAGADATLNVYSNNNTLRIGTTTVNATATNDTINAGGSNNVIFDFAGGNEVNLGAATEYVGGPNTTESTLISASGGNDTILASTKMLYQGTAANSSLFVGNNTQQVTVNAAANETLFGGGAGGIYNESNNSSGTFFFWGRMANTPTTAATVADTITGTASSPTATIWGNTNSDTFVSQSGTARAYEAGNAFVAYGENDTINATDARGGNQFILWNANVNGSNFTGDTTLDMSTEGNEVIGLFAQLTATAPSSAHTIVINNWTSTDLLYIGGYSAADLTTAENALKAGGGGGVSFTLSDHTTVTFVGKSPTAPTSSST